MKTRQRRFTKFISVLLCMLIVVSVVVVPAVAETVRINESYDISLSNSDSTFENLSTISATKINLGESVTITANAVGDYSPYTYSFGYVYDEPHQIENVILPDTETTAVYTPERAGTVKITVHVKNSMGYIDDKTFTLTVLSGSGNNNGNTNNDDNKTSEIKIKQVSLGEDFSAAITQDGTLYTWGYNYAGRLGYNTNISRDTPTKIMDNVVCVSFGDQHSAAITSDGSLYTWGCNDFGQLGDGTYGLYTERYTPTKIMDNVVSVSLGSDHSAAITSDGSLYTWGSNRFGQLGDGTTTYRSTPTKIMDNVVSVSLGSGYSAAITSDGSLYTWGRILDGKSICTYRYTPTKIMDNVVSVSLSGKYSAAITSDGNLYTWGCNYFGRLGDGTTTDRSTPTKIMDNVVYVSSYGVDNHSAAITDDGNLYVWGENSYGTLGVGAGIRRYIPTQITVTPNTLITTGIPINLEVGETKVIEARYYDENLNLAEIDGGVAWSCDDNVDIHVIGNEFKNYKVEVTGKKEGKCNVTAHTKEPNGLSAKTAVHVSYYDTLAKYYFYFSDEYGATTDTNTKSLKWENGKYSQKK